MKSSAYKYYLKSNFQALCVFYGIIFSIILVGSIISLNQKEVRFSGFDFSSMIFIFVLGINSFTEIFRMFLQNGRSRRTLFINFLLSSLTIIVVMTLIDSLISIMIYSTYYSIFDQIYGGIYQKLIIKLSWSFSTYFFIVLLGYFIRLIYYRMSKVLTYIVSFGVPIFIFVIFPFTDAMTNFTLTSSIYKISQTIYRSSNGNLIPYPYILTMIIFSGILIVLNYLLIKRVEVKE